MDGHIEPMLPRDACYLNSTLVGALPLPSISHHVCSLVAAKSYRRLAFAPRAPLVNGCVIPQHFSVRVPFAHVDPIAAAEAVESKGKVSQVGMVVADVRLIHASCPGHQGPDPRRGCGMARDLLDGARSFGSEGGTKRPFARGRETGRGMGMGM